VVALLLVQLVLVQRVAAVHGVLQRLHVVVQVSRVGLRRLWFTLGGHGLTVRQSGGVRGTTPQSVLHPAYPGTMTEFAYSDLLPLGPDETEYRLVTDEGVETFEAGGQRFLRVDPLALTRLTDEAMHDIAHYLRPAHLAQLRRIVDDPESSGNDRFVALDLLKNANIAAAGVLPMCQDTGTAIVMGKKGERVVTGGDDAAAISRGVYDAYSRLNLRYSQLAPLTMWDETNTGSNLPAQVEIYSTPSGSDPTYQFLFMAKGGGSANKSFLYQETKAVLNPDAMLRFLDEKLRALGTAACPPYHLAVVVGGTSAEYALKTAKYASAKYLDELPTSGSPTAHGFRDLELEAQVLELTRGFGIGAQFGGKYFCHDVRVVRLPRHGASCPVAIAVSCSADRQARGKITAEGVFLEQLETDPARFLPDTTDEHLDDAGEAVRIDLNRPMDEIRATLSTLPVKTRLSLSGPLVVARDIAHAKIKERLDAGEPMPSYLRDHAVYYAGPAKTPEGYASGSFGPTTAGRMDSYVAQFQEAGGSFVMLAKGNRSAQVTEACKRFGGFYLGSIGGPAARLAQDCIKSVDVVEYADLGMEAVWKIEVEDFPAFVVVDDKGNDFFAETFRPVALTIGRPLA
jgi:fumarate hydratase class I